MKLIFIHGRAQEGKNPVKLQKQWETAFRRGLKKAGLDWPPGVTVAFPFYGDRLDELIQAVNAPLVEEVLTRGAGPDSREAEFRGELLYEMASARGITDEQIQAHFKGQLHEKGPLNWEWVQAILRALDATPLGEAAIDMFTRDVYVYLTCRAVQNAVDAIVAAELTAGPCVVVGHSLGSVVGYNVLRRIPEAVLVRRYVTVGSPLGAKAIKRRLDHPLAMPLTVSDWYNAMDGRDVVALYPVDDRNFPLTPAIMNHTKVNNRTANRHGITGYLDDPWVARQIHEATQLRLD